MAPDEVAGAADRAGRLIQDQIAAVTDAARSSAAESERQAQESASNKRSAGEERAAAVLEGIRAIERELTILLHDVSAEADGLQAKLGQASTQSGPTGEGAVEQAPMSDADSAEAQPAADREEGPSQADPMLEPASDDQAAHPRSDSESWEKPSTADGLRWNRAAGDFPAAATVLGREAADRQDEASEESADAELLTADTEELRGLLAEKTDLALAELYRTAASEQSEPAESDADLENRGRLAKEIVEEAARRPDFGTQAEETSSGGRRARKRRSRTLGPLAIARDLALQESAGND